MKRTLIFALILGTAVVALPAIEARANTGTATVNVEQDWRYEQRRGRNRGRGYGYGRVRTYITTRIVRRGWSTYRETIRVTRWPNGRTRSQVIRRVRIR